MKKILAIIGSPRNGETCKAVRIFEEKLNKTEMVDFEYLYLKDLNVQPCKGCNNCFVKGEDSCPVYDDTEKIINKMMGADGVIFATPVYSLQVSGQMKILLDRLAYVFHRPCMFGKVFIAIAVQGIYGYKDVIKYLKKVAHFWGFTVVKGVGLDTPPGPRTVKMQTDIEMKIDRGVRDFYRALCSEKFKSPGFSDLIMFRMIRTAKPYLDIMPRDYEYFCEKGWMESDYYYPVKLGPVKKLVGMFFDKQGKKNGEKMKRERDDV